MLASRSRFIGVWQNDRGYPVGFVPVYPGGELDGLSKGRQSGQVKGLA